MEQLFFLKVCSLSVLQKNSSEMQNSNEMQYQQVPYAYYALLIL